MQREAVKGAARESREDSCWQLDAVVVQLQDQHGCAVGEVKLRVAFELDAAPAANVSATGNPSSRSRSRSNSGSIRDNLLVRTLTGSAVKMAMPCTVSVSAMTARGLKLMDVDGTNEAYLQIHLGDAHNLERQTQRTAAIEDRRAVQTMVSGVVLHR